MSDEPENRGLRIGFAMAIASLVRQFDQPSMAADLIDDYGFDLDDFRHCDDYDLKVIRKLFRTESALRKQAKNLKNARGK